MRLDCHCVADGDRFVRASTRHARALAPACASAVTLGSLLIFATWAHAASDTPRFTLSGAGALSLERVQRTATLELKANLTSPDAAVAALPPLQEGGGFALIARASGSASVCYNDTIFRDDYDGDGR
jgi:hypothetical protein